MKEKRSKNLYWQRQKSAYEAAAVSISHYMCMHSVIQCTLNAVNKQLSCILKERKNVYIVPLCLVTRQHSHPVRETGPVQ